MADNLQIRDSAGATKSVATKEISSNHHSKVILTDASGNLYTPGQIEQKVTTTTDNTFSGTLGAGLTATAAAGEFTLNVAGIQITVTNNQAATLYVYQSTDNATWVLTDSFDIAKNANWGDTVGAIGTYFKTAIKNRSTGTLTYSVTSVLCPIAQALPRALTTSGNLKTAVREFGDFWGFQGRFSPAHDLQVCEPYRMVGSSFTGSTIDTNFWTATNSGTGSSASMTNGLVSLVSGTTTTGYGQIASVRQSRYLAAHPQVFRGYFRVTNATITDCTRRWGASTVSTTTPQDGCYFELSGAGVLSCVTVSGGTPSAVASGSWTGGSVPEFTVDTNLHTYQIIYTQTGFRFFIDDVLVHVATPTTTRLTTTLNVNALATCINSGSAGATGTLECWGMSILRLGRAETQPTSKQQVGTGNTQCKLGAGSLHGLVISNVLNGSIITLYDNTSTGGGTTIWTSGSIVVTTGQNPGIVPVMFPKPIPFYTGLNVTVGTAACNVLAVYE